MKREPRERNKCGPLYIINNLCNIKMAALIKMNKNVIPLDLNESSSLSILISLKYHQNNVIKY